MLFTDIIIEIYIPNALPMPLENKQPEVVESMEQDTTEQELHDLQEEILHNADAKESAEVTHKELQTKAHDTWNKEINYMKSHGIDFTKLEHQEIAIGKDKKIVLHQREKDTDLLEIRFTRKSEKSGKINIILRKPTLTEAKAISIEKTYV